MSPLLVADVPDTDPVMQVANALFDQLLAFGRMASAPYTIFADHAQFNRRVEVPAYSVFAYLEDRANLRFAEVCPHSYSFGTWPDEYPIGGWAGPGRDGPPPSECLRAMSDHWEASVAPRSTTARLLRSALFVASAEGLSCAVDYLMSLHEMGWAPQEDSLRVVLSCLIRARSQCDSDDGTVHLLCGGPPPGTTADWMTLEPQDGAVTVSHRLAEWGPASGGLLMRVLSRVITYISSVRDSDNYDDWLSGTLNAFGAARLAMALCHPADLFDGKEPPLGLQAVLSGLAEIAADGVARTHNGLLRTLPPVSREDLSDMRAGLLTGSLLTEESVASLRFMEDFLVPGLARDLGLARSVAAKYRATYGSGWEQKLVDDRLLVPRTLGAACLECPPSALAMEWRTLSPRFADAYGALFSPSFHPARLRITPLPAAKVILSNPDLAAGIHERGIPEGDIQAFVSGCLTLLQAQYNPADRLPQGHVDYSAEEVALVEALSQLSDQPLLMRDTLDAVRIGQQNASADEIIAALQRIADREEKGETEDALAACLALLGDYPWCDDALALRGRLECALGSVSTGISSLVSAIGMEPGDADRWALLSEACRLSGDERAARESKDLGTLQALYA